VSLKEEYIRPGKIFKEYLRLCQEDTKTYFYDSVREEIFCPACESNGNFAFVKDGFTYEICIRCDSLYVSPRPDSNTFTKYYREAPSVEFWASTFYKETAEARREKLWKPKAKLIMDILHAQNVSDFSIIDIGGGYGIFAEEIHKLVDERVTVIEPGPTLAGICRDKNLVVIEKFLEDVFEDDLPRGGKAFVSFELFEHLHNPQLFLEQLRALMSSGDLFIFTTLSGTGVDIQALWEHSKSVSPPHHLNFLNPKSIQILLERCGFEMIEVTTPGKLDIDILFNNQTQIKDRFWKTFVKNATEEEKELAQQMVTENKMSSHMMVCCKKP
jgi:SAM-dependent methyltransferase